MIHKRQIFLGIIVLFFIGLFAASFSAQNVFKSFIEFISGIISQQPKIGALVFILLGCFSILLGPFTSSPLLPPAVAVWGNLLTVIMLLIGWLAGNTLAYFIGQRYGYPVVSKFVKKKKLDEWIVYARGNLPFSLMLLFRLATPSETGYIFGLLNYSFKKYMLATLISEAPFALLSVYGSFALLEGEWAFVLLTLVGWASVASFAIFMFRKKFNA